MAREPQYPQDTPVGEPAPGEKRKDGETPAAAESERKGRKQLVTGAAIGIGSAALVAALLYANRSRKSGKPGGER